MEDYSLLATIIGYLKHSFCISSNMILHSATTRSYFCFLSSSSLTFFSSYSQSIWTFLSSSSICLSPSSFSFSSDCFSYFFKHFNCCEFWHSLSLLLLSTLIYLLSFVIFKLLLLAIIFNIQSVVSLSSWRSSSGSSSLIISSLHRFLSTLMLAYKYDWTL